MSLKIEIDIRENKIIENINIQYPNINIIIQQLDIGDIIITNEYSSILIERKTKEDVISSIKDGRWKNQKYRILENFDKCIYVIEGDNILNNDPILSGAYINTICRDKIPIIFTKSVTETVIFIKNIYDKLIANPSRFVNTNNYISTLKAKTKKIDNIDKKNCLILQLSQIPTINTKIATKIENIHNSMKDLIDTLSNTDDPIKYLQQIHNIGEKKAEKIIKYLL